MIQELMNNKFLWVGVATLFGLLVYKFLFSKDKANQVLEQEYSEIINSDEYKVKGQFD
ncbi:hypothetical protein HYU23_01120 [Candidatus Woesearchaeota archaeon]|nr:hypothetical protein [Candidatus Woesearchaeota archaeon]